MTHRLVRLMALMMACMLLMSVLPASVAEEAVPAEMFMQPIELFVNEEELPGVPTEEPIAEPTDKPCTR